MEKTLIIFKPDCMEKRCVGEVIRRFESEGFGICDSKMMTLPRDLLREHYAHLIHLPFFGGILDFMSLRPVVLMVFEGENIVERVRELLGPTDSTAAPKGTVRGDLGTDKMRNVVHASDSPENAAAEIERFFS